MSEGRRWGTKSHQQHPISKHDVLMVCTVYTHYHAKFSSHDMHVTSLLSTHPHPHTWLPADVVCKAARIQRHDNAELVPLLGDAKQAGHKLALACHMVQHQQLLLEPLDHGLVGIVTIARV